MEFSSEGVKYKESWASNLEGSEKLSKHSIIDSLNFPFDLKDSPVMSSSESVLSDDTKVLYSVNKRISEPIDTLMNGERVSIIYSHGLRTWRFKYPQTSIFSDEITAKDLVIYQKGKGAVFLRTFDDNGEIFRMEFDKILSIEEFENKKNAS